MGGTHRSVPLFLWLGQLPPHHAATAPTRHSLPPHLAGSRARWPGFSSHAATARALAQHAVPRRSRALAPPPSSSPVSASTPTDFAHFRSHLLRALNTGRVLHRSASPHCPLGVTMPRQTPMSGASCKLFALSLFKPYQGTLYPSSPPQYITLLPSPLTKQKL